MGEVAAWLHQYAWAVWGLAGLGLAAVELRTRDLTLLMLAVGALAGAVTALILPSMFWTQVVAALAVAAAALFLLRPMILRRPHSALGPGSLLDSLIGAGGRATSQIGRDGGEVQVRGQVWDARSFDPAVTIAEGQDIEVYGIDGITLIVHPVRPQGEGP